MSEELRMTTVVNPHSAPAANAKASPSHHMADVSLTLFWDKPSCNAKATAANANSNPNHCINANRSVFTNRGNNKATQKGAVYKKMVKRDALVCCSPT